MTTNILKDTQDLLDQLGDSTTEGEGNLKSKLDYLEKLDVEKDEKIETIKDKLHEVLTDYSKYAKQLGNLQTKVSVLEGCEIELENTKEKLLFL